MFAAACILLRKPRFRLLPDPKQLYLLTFKGFIIQNFLCIENQRKHMSE